MRAAVLSEFERPLEITDLPKPEPLDDEVLIRVRATGLCGTDLKLQAGAFRATTRLPLVPGHEVAGEIVEGATDLACGQRVSCYVYETCGSCLWCRAGRPTLCPDRVRMGLERNGGLAQFAIVKRANLIPFSDDLAFEKAAVSMDAVASPWGALHGRARIRSGERVLVVGAGGLGINGVQIARAAGCSVAVVDPVASHRELALERGAELAVDPDDAGEIHAWSDIGIDLALETSGARAGFDTAAAALRAGGRVVCCGYYPGTEYGLDSARLVLNEIDVMGSVSASLPLARDALRAVEAGEVTPPIMEVVPLDAVNEALDTLRRGGVLGRMVVTPPDA
jgi:2-desacetyl-2-hydroxyethyl bacteriochlorophyllide A dehydrogenase